MYVVPGDGSGTNPPEGDNGQSNGDNEQTNGHSPYSFPHIPFGLPAPPIPPLPNPNNIPLPEEQPETSMSANDIKVVITPFINQSGLGYITVKVTDRSGKPLQGAQITENTTRIKWSTNADGIAYLQMPRAKVSSITVEYNGKTTTVTYTTGFE